MKYRFCSCEKDRITYTPSLDMIKDFRKEWQDGFLEHEGNEYGNTSDFYTIRSVRRFAKTL